MLNGTKALRTRILHAGTASSDLLPDVGRRVSVAAATFATVWAVVALMANITRRTMGSLAGNEVAWDLFGNQLAAALIAVSLLLAYGARRLRHRPDLVLGLGLGYEVVGAVAVAALSQWNPPLVGRGISWNCMMILVFPAIVPARPGPVLLTSLIAASADPVLYMLARHAGVADPPLPGQLAVWMFLPSYICAILAVIPASLVRRLGHAARKARDLGSYRLGELLGRGGMGEVYRASHRLLARPAAVKLISPDLIGRDEDSRETMIARFHREAASAASLRSPHTIGLYDFGIAEDHTFYYAMELLDGINLHTLVRTHGPVEPARAVYLLRQACISLAEAHRHGFVHRDIKPSNLMICRMGTQVDFVKVLDFGLVKVEENADTALTGPNVAAGTPEFMAPEAVHGVGMVDHRADLYALGCVAYWLLSGRPVFKGSTAIAVLLKHVSEAPPPLDSPFGPVPDDLAAVVTRCLSKNPEHRYADALALERALAACEVAGGWDQDQGTAWWSANYPEERAA